MSSKPKLIRLTTIPISMNIIMRGQLAYMNRHFEVIGVTSYDEKHFNECQEREGIRMHAVDMVRTIAFFKDIIALWKLIFLFRREKPTIVHTHTPKAGLLGMLAALLTGVPVRMHTVGGMPLLETVGIKRTILNFAERLTYTCAHHVYPNSHGLKNIIQSLNFCDSAKLKVLGNGGSNGVNLDFFSPDFLGSKLEARATWRKKMNIGVDAVVFCFVGRIAREKGMEELLTAFKTLKNKTMNLKLLLIGPFEKSYGVVDESIRNKIMTDEDIIAPGRFDDVRPYYLLSDIYVFPSYREGFPNTLLEAGAMGLPSIVTNINGCNEIIEHGVNGLIVPPKNTDALREAMQQLLSNEERDRLANKSREVIIKKFGREVVWEALLFEYKQQISKLNVSA